MGLFVNQQNRRSQLQEKIVADLREKAKNSDQGEKPQLPDIEDSKYFEGTSQVSGTSWAWLLFGIIAVIFLIVFFMM